ncbi:DUF3237 domain-containing protein [Nocardia sp. NPDC051030]|uniref:DUF3237 domain-containing protein n=1 Tax=Nocardia sp. NPDC051030 TaxID=3155162 RepID=UPI00341BE971
MSENTQVHTGLLELPLPTAVNVEHVMDVEIDLDGNHTLQTPVAFRIITVAGGGTFQGPRVRGTVLAGGGDWVVLGSDRISRLDVRLTLRTEDNELIYMTCTGRLAITNKEAAQRYTEGDTITGTDLEARAQTLFETGAEQYAWLNSTVNVSLVEMSRTRVVYRVLALV